MVFSLGRFQGRHGGQGLDVSGHVRIPVEPSANAWIHEPLPKLRHWDRPARLLVQSKAREEGKCVAAGELQFGSAVGIEAKAEPDVACRLLLPNADAPTAKLCLVDHRNDGRIVVEAAGDRSKCERANTGFDLERSPAEA